MVAVLDNFHFDLSFVTSKDLESDQLPQDKNQSELSTETKPPVGLVGTDISAVSESDSHKTPPMGSESLVDCEQKELLPGEEAVQEDIIMSECADKEKSRAFARKILKAILNSILPGLQGALTKRVSGATCVSFL